MNKDDMIQYDCIIIGAGLSGLACALTLHKSGLKVLVIESEAQVGGRVSTVKTKQGFRVDVGFQVLLNSYPELSRFVDISSLNLQKFNSGALIFDGQKLELLANPFVHPETLFSSFFNSTLTTKDKILLLKLLAESQLAREDFPLGTITTIDFLKQFGFSENFIELFWRPFLTGIYLDADLELGDHFFKFLIRCFGNGKVSLPMEGMAELPFQMAQQLPQNSILLNRAVTNWSPHEVTSADGIKWYAKNVVCAFDTSSEQPTDFRPVTTHYFTSPKLNETAWGKWLILVPRKLGLKIDHFCLISAVAEGYGNGNPLLSVSVVGSKKVSVEEVIADVNRIATRDLGLEWVTSHSVPRALPRLKETSSGYKLEKSVYHCGDRWASPSINGALRSGRLTAEAILKEQESF